MASPFNRSGARSGATRKDAKAMGNMLAGGKNARGSIYSRTMREPERERLLSSRSLVALALLLFLPPVGIGLIWRKQMFLPRGRWLLTIASTLVLMGMLVFFMPSTALETVRPAPVSPSAYTRLEGLEAQADYERIARISDQQVSASASIAVYLLNGDQTYYHANTQCGDLNQVALILTVAQAQERSMQPCPNCKPAQ